MTAIDWPNDIPAGCPFPRSTSFSRVRFTGRYATYTDADTWYPSWATDGDLYSPWTDGVVNGQACLSFQQRLAMNVGARVAKFHMTASVRRELDGEAADAT